PGVRGALARGEDHGYTAVPGAFLASPHVAQEIAWLQAAVTWALPEGLASLRIEGGTLVSGDPPTVRSPDAAGILTIPAGGHPLRCHALLFCLRVNDLADGPGGEGARSMGTEGAVAGPIVGVQLAALEGDAWQSAAT